MSRIIVTGDTHGTVDIGKLSPKDFRTGKKLTKDDYVIILGDSGIIWYGGRKDATLKKWYDEKPWTTLFIDGNHENHHSLALYPVEEWNGGKVHRISDSIIHLMRGEYYNIDGRTFWVMGGAESIDKIYRTEGESWWKEEMPTHEELEYGLSNLQKHDMTVDYVLTHDCATSIAQVMYGVARYPSELTNFFDHLEFDFGLQFKMWYFGHHHQDRLLDKKHVCLYKETLELGHENFQSLLGGRLQY